MVYYIDIIKLQAANYEHMYSCEFLSLKTDKENYINSKKIA